MKLHTFRLKTGQDLRVEIEKFTKDKDIKAGFVVTCVGALNPAKLRMAGATPDNQQVKIFEGKYEIVSLEGTISLNGAHLHVAISDQGGNVIGGHLKEDSIVDLCAEIVLGEDESAVYSRELDPQTGFPELVVNPDIT